MTPHPQPKPMFTYNYAMGSLTSDVVMLTIRNRRLHILLILRGEPPFEDMWALPGGHVNLHQDPKLSESSFDAAHRETEEETGLPRGSCRLVKYGSFSTPGRDPRGNYMTEVFAAFISPSMFHLIKHGQVNDDAKETEWFPVDELPPLAFDHKEIIADTLARVMKDLLTTDIAFDLLPPEFSVADLRSLYEMVRGKPIDRSNFHRQFKRMMEEGLVEACPTNHKPKLYRRPKV